MYNLGSVNKLFTRLAIGQLVQDGKLAFGDTLGTALPEYPNAEARQKVTIRHLIEMRSGIGDFFGKRFDATSKDRFRTNADYLPMFAADPLAFEPGYLAEGYTRLWGPEEKEMDGPRRKNIYSRPARGSAAGGGYSTAEDLLRFVNAVLADKLLSPPYTDWFVSGRDPGEGVPPPRADGDIRWIGGAPGINAVLDADLASRYAIIVLGNYDPPAAASVAQTARRILSGVVERRPAVP